MNGLHSTLDRRVVIFSHRKENLSMTSTVDQRRVGYTADDGELHLTGRKLIAYQENRTSRIYCRDHRINLEA
jgi:hypothetical protein